MKSDDSSIPFVILGIVSCEHEFHVRPDSPYATARGEAVTVLGTIAAWFVVIHTHKVVTRLRSKALLYCIPFLRFRRFRQPFRSSAIILTTIQTWLSHERSLRNVTRATSRSLLVGRAAARRMANPFSALRYRLRHNSCRPRTCCPLTRRISRSRPLHP